MSITRLSSFQQAGARRWGGGMGGRRAEAVGWGEGEAWVSEPGRPWASRSSSRGLRGSRNTEAPPGRSGGNKRPLSARCATSATLGFHRRRLL